MFRHARDQAGAEAAIELLCITTKHSIAQRRQSRFGGGGIPLSQRAEHPIIGDALKSSWVAGPDGVDRLMQRTRVRFPLEVHYGALYLGVDVVWLESESAIERRSHIAVAAQLLIAERNLLKHKEVARIKLKGALEVLHTL